MHIIFTSVFTYIYVASLNSNYKLCIRKCVYKNVNKINYPS